MTSSNLLIRTAAATVFGTAAVLVILAHPLAFLSLGMIVSALTYLEYTLLVGMKFNAGSENRRWPGPWFAVIGALTYALVSATAAGFVPGMALVGLFPLALLSMVPDAMGRSGRRATLAALAGWIYIPLNLGLLNMAVFPDHQLDERLLLGVLALIWTNDIFAYLTGKTAGRRKLWPSVSPNKTVEGLAGGMAACLLLAWAWGTLWTNENTGRWMAIGAIVAVFANAGDLMESGFKRWLGVKDSGAIMPGHGGLLDRLDGLLLVSPAITVYLLSFD